MLSLIESVKRISQMRRGGIVVKDVRLRNTFTSPNMLTVQRMQSVAFTELVTTYHTLRKNCIDGDNVVVTMCDGELKPIGKFTDCTLCRENIHLTLVISKRLIDELGLSSVRPLNAQLYYRDVTSTLGIYINLNNRD